MITYTGTSTGTQIQLKGNFVKPKRLNVNNTKEVANFMVDLIRKNRRTIRYELNDWQRARNIRYNSDTQSPNLLVQIYKDALLDGHLTAVTENRTLRTANKDYVILDKAGKIDMERSKFLDKKWFFDLTKQAHESTYHGYSLVLIEEAEPSHIKKVKLIPREYVNPVTHQLLRDPGDEKGLDYQEYPNELLYAQMYDDVGLLEKAVPYTILKRHSWASWDEFEELFGVPIRIAKIASNSDAVKNEVASWLAEMGSAAYGIFPTGTEVEIKENSKADAFQVFYKKLETLDKEISKLILHQTMTTDSGSSRSQGEVHEATLDEVIKADEKNMLAWLNDVLLPIMRHYGYDIPEDYSIGLRIVVNPEKQIVIDDKLMTHGYVLTQNYVEGTYGVEIESMPEQTKEDPAEKKNFK